MRVLNRCAQSDSRIEVRVAAETAIAADSITQNDGADFP